VLVKSNSNLIESCDRRECVSVTGLMLITGQQHGELFLRAELTINCYGEDPDDSPLPMICGSWRMTPICRRLIMAIARRFRKKDEE